jgi:two-component system, cell cycle response regulator
LDAYGSEGSGDDFIRAIQAEPPLRGIFFVFLITSTTLDEQEWAKGRGPDAARFLMRPIEPREFLAAIRDFLLEKARS